MKKPTIQPLPHNRPLESTCIFNDNKILILASLNDRQYCELLKILVPSDSKDSKQ